MLLMKMMKKYDITNNGIMSCRKSEERKWCVNRCRGFKSIMLKSVTYIKDKFRDELIKIAMFCSETEITSFVRTFTDAAALFNKSSPEV